MTKRTQTNKFWSIPYALFFPVFSFICTIFMILMILGATHSNQAHPLPILFFISIIVYMNGHNIYYAPYSLCQIEIKSDRIICHIPFHKNVEIEYEKCYIGFDYHNQNGGKIWWIYFSYGKMPPYKNPQLGNRINSIKCQPGFVRIMYRDEVYNALLETLPPKQKTALEAARRHSGFEKQRKIYM